MLRTSTKFILPRHGGNNNHRSLLLGSSWIIQPQLESQPSIRNYSRSCNNGVLSTMESPLSFFSNIATSKHSNTELSNIYMESVLGNKKQQQNFRAYCSTSIQNKKAMVTKTTGSTTKAKKKTSSSCSSKKKVKKEIAMPDPEKELELSDIQMVITEHYKRGDYNLALKKSKELLNETLNHFGEEHPVTASSYNNLGLMNKLLGHYDEAHEYYKQAQRIYGKVVGRDHMSYALTLHNIGTLYQSQVHLDPSLSALQRVSLMENALEYIQEALIIQQDELGNDHPHTLASQSSIGSILAAQVLYQHKAVIDENRTATATTTDGSNTTTSTTATGGTESEQQQQRYVALNPKGVTEQGWDAAEEHLRKALETAVANPRGRSIRIPKTKGGGNSKKKKQSSSSSSKRSDLISQIRTLSAAAAAQHLAVVLKSRAVTLDPPQQDWLREASDLYRQVLLVRSQLLQTTHPDVYATKYSLAEVLDVLNEKDEANTIRTEILDTYDPQTN